MSDYWEKYYNSHDVDGSTNHHINVGRTKNGKVISEEVWKNTLVDIENILGLKNTHDI